MLFRILIEEFAAGWRVRVLNRGRLPLNGPLAYDRTLGLGGARPFAFPLPPAGEAGAWPEDALHKALCTDTEATVLRPAFRKIVQRLRPGAHELETFGRYLFATLLGRAHWNEIKRLAQEQEQAIELALCWQAGDTAINRLPWEMMHDGEDFLARQPRIAITRRVAGSGAQIDAITCPPRVLFAVGSALEDADISAGAEYHTLLRRIKHQSLPLKTHLVTETSTEILAREVAGFNPTAAHLVCHGATDPDGKGYLRMAHPTDKGRHQEVYAGNLARALRANGDLLPQIVVLNACKSAASTLRDAGEPAFPLAAELVEAGVPIVVGMSGDVSHQVCRLFTRRFYEALMEGSDVAQAVAEGRRAAITQGTDPHKTVDWAFPVLYLSDAVEELRVSPALLELEQTWQERASAFAMPDYPAFCDRHEFLRWHDLLLTASPEAQRAARNSTSPLRALVVGSGPPPDKVPEGARPQNGRTWLLKAFACKAVRDGHVPILVSRPAPSDPSPRTLDALIYRIQDAAYETASEFGVTAPTGCVDAVLESEPGAPLPPCIANQGIRPRSITAENRRECVAAALRLDLMQLLAEMRALRPEGEREATKLLLLIDDVHEMDDAVVDLLYGLLGGRGLDNPGARDHVAVVLTYDTQAEAGKQTVVGTIQEWVDKEAPHAQHLVLGQFAEPERWHAYKHFLLHWKNNGTRKPLAVNRSYDETVKERIQTFFRGLHREVQGVPSLLTSDRTSFLIQWTYDLLMAGSPEGQVLRDADDEDALRAVRNEGMGE